jgi:hypothetical protein
MVQNVSVNSTTATDGTTATKPQQQGMRGLDMWDKRGSFFGSLPRPHLPHVGSSSGGGLGSAFANLNLSVNSATATATANTTTAAGTGAASSGSGDDSANAGNSSKKKKKRPNVWAERPARPPSGHSMFSPFSVNTNRFRPPSFRNVSIPR